MRIACDDVGADLDAGDVAQIQHRPRTHTHRRVQQHLHIPANIGVGAGNTAEVVDTHHARRHHRSRLTHGCNRFFWRHTMLSQLIGIKPHHHCALVAAKRWRCRNALQSRKQRPHLVERDVLHVAGAACRARKHELPHSNRAGVKARYKRWHRAGGKERARAIHIADHFGHRLIHIRARIERQFDQRRPLYTLRFHMLYARNIQQMILIIVGDEAFHLLRIKPAIGLCDVHRRRAKIGKNIDTRPLHRKPGGQNNRQHRNHNRDRSPQRQQNQFHRVNFRNGSRSPTAPASFKIARQMLRFTSPASISVCASTRSASATSRMVESPA